MGATMGDGTTEEAAMGATMGDGTGGEVQTGGTMEEEGTEEVGMVIGMVVVGVPCPTACCGSRLLRWEGGRLSLDTGKR